VRSKEVYFSGAAAKTKKVRRIWKGVESKSRKVNVDRARKNLSKPTILSARSQAQIWRRSCTYETD
jgi:hypothetical protein